MEDGLLDVDRGTHDIGQIGALVIRHAGYLFGTGIEALMELCRSLGQSVSTRLELPQTIAQLHDARGNFRSFRGEVAAGVGGVVDSLVEILGS